MLACESQGANTLQVRPGWRINAAHDVENSLGELNVAIIDCVKQLRLGAVAVPGSHRDSVLRLPYLIGTYCTFFFLER